ncbi:rRNA maturation RNase YbeY [Candidatus Wolfebacteria bacterium]|nr:rRNA maturation RNase YbeY [Candidatus Wolfebacteria bacterium]
MNKISVISLGKNKKEIEEKLKILILKTLKILKKDNVLIDIYLISGIRMKFLNKKFRGKDKTTTILSFVEPRNFILPPSKFRKLGEIYLNIANIKHQELRDKLAVHGVLHLLGYNHNRKSDRIKMEKKEKWIIGKLDSCNNRKSY